MVYHKLNSNVHKSGFIDLDLPIPADPEKAEQLNNKILLVKFGGNAMVDKETKWGIVEDLVALKKAGAVPIVVHGGGPAIRKLLDEIGIESEFVDGHRKTDSKTMGYVEMALSGRVNAEIVHLANKAGMKAVGLSGKDGRMVTATKRTHEITVDGEQKEVDLGHVGDVENVDTSLVRTLINDGYLPVISPVAAGEEMAGYNVNADMFAGHMAGALQADHYLALTNVNGIRTNPEDPESRVNEWSLNEAQSEVGHSIREGMIPKVESCIIALKEGVASTHIIDGTTRHSLLRQLLTEEQTGTRIGKEIKKPVN